MAKFYEPLDPNGIQNDNDLRIAIANKTKNAIYELKKIINKNIEIYSILTLQNGEQAYHAYPNKKELLDFSLYLDAFTGLIVNNICVLLGKGKNDHLSISKQKTNFNEKAINDFYSKNEEKIKSIVDARNKVYAHIDTDVTENAFLVDLNFMEECIDFLKEMLEKGTKQ